MQEGSFDAVFMQVVQANKGIDGFFDEVFGFFRRKTDFFTNPKQGEETIRNTFGQALLKYNQQKIEEQEKQKAKDLKEKERLRKQQEKQLQQQQQEQPKQPEVPKPVPVVQQPVPSQPQPDKKGEEEEDKGPAPIGNGGSTDKYSWTQTLQEMSMNIPVDNDLKSKQIQISIGVQHLTVQLNGQKFIDADFPEKINVDDSLWTLESEGKQKYINVLIQKFSGQMHWWDCALKGDATIDTKKINPENSKLSDLEGETRTTVLSLFQVEKMMFDMRQKQMGLPSSDEMQKQDMMKNFMKQHPEMDFSKCKFN